MAVSERSRGVDMLRVRALLAKAKTGLSSLPTQLLLRLDSSAHGETQRRDAEARVRHRRGAPTEAAPPGAGTPGSPAKQGGQSRGTVASMRLVFKLYPNTDPTLRCFFCGDTGTQHCFSYGHKTGKSAAPDSQIRRGVHKACAQPYRKLWPPTTPSSPTVSDQIWERWNATQR